MTGLEVGDVVAFNDAWFLRRRMPVPPIEQRNICTVRVAGTDRVLVDVPDRDGRRWWQLVPSDWLMKVIDGEAPLKGGEPGSREADAASNPL